MISTQIVLDPEGRRKELAELGIPVIQALAYRKGDEAAWRADPQGVPLIDVPFYLAQGEYAGIVDAIVASTSDKTTGEVVALPEQAAAIVEQGAEAGSPAAPAECRQEGGDAVLELPAGRRTCSASFMNLPRSFETTLKALRDAGYDTHGETEESLIKLLQRLLAPFYRDGELAGLLRDGLAERLPVATYKAWLQRQPAAVQDELRERWGDPGKIGDGHRSPRRSGLRHAAPGRRQGHLQPAGTTWRTLGGEGKSPLPLVQGGAVAFLPGPLPVVARALQGRRAGALRYARLAGMAARQGARPGRHRLPAARHRRCAGGLSLHRRQHRRSAAGQAARPGGHRHPTRRRPSRRPGCTNR